MSQNREILEIPLNKIVASENSRQVYDPQEMAELMVSMKQTGLLQPVGVTPLPKGGFYKLIFGFRRFVGANKLGWEKIDAVLVEAKNDEEALIKNSIENVIRENVSFPQQGRIFAGLTKKGLTQEQIAARIGCAKSFVNTALNAYYRIPKKIQKRLVSGTRGTNVKAGQLTPTAAFEVVQIAQKAKLTEQQAERLYDYASEKGVGKSQVTVVGQLLGKDYSLREAITRSKSTRIVTVQFGVDIDRIQRLEAKYKMPIHDIAYTWLEQNKEMQIYPMRKKHQDKVVSVTRKKEA